MQYIQYADVDIRQLSVSILPVYHRLSTRNSYLSGWERGGRRANDEKKRWRTLGIGFDCLFAVNLWLCSGALSACVKYLFEAEEEPL
jgi:hypothetical protein